MERGNESGGNIREAEPRLNESFHSSSYKCRLSAGLAIEGDSGTVGVRYAEVQGAHVPDNHSERGQGNIRAGVLILNAASGKSARRHAGTWRDAQHVLQGESDIVPIEVSETKKACVH